MKYTLNEGVDRTDENIQRGLLVSLPVVFAVLLLILFHAGNQPAPNPSPKPTPKTLSVSTNKPSSSPSGNNSSNISTSTDSSGSGNAATPSAQVARASSVQSTGAINTQPASPPPTGGRGGGDGGSGGGGGQIIICNNMQQIGTLTCDICIPAVVLQPGQKAVLSTDGSCAVIN